MALKVTTGIDTNSWILGSEFRSGLEHDIPFRNLLDLSFREAETWQSETLEIWAVNW